MSEHYSTRPPSRIEGAKVVFRTEKGWKIIITQGEKISKIWGTSDGDRRVWVYDPTGRFKWCVPMDALAAICREWAKIEEFLYPRFDKEGKKTGYRGRNKVLALAKKAIQDWRMTIEDVCASEQLPGYEYHKLHKLMHNDSQRNLFDDENGDKEP